MTLDAAYDIGKGGSQLAEWFVSDFDVFSCVFFLSHIWVLMKTFG